MKLHSASNNITIRRVCNCSRTRSVHVNLRECSWIMEVGQNNPIVLQLRWLRQKHMQD